MRCSDCGRDIGSTKLEGVCAKRSGHEARCACTVARWGPFSLPPGARPGEIAGRVVHPSCPVHGTAERGTP